MALVLIHGYAETGNIFKDIIPHIHFKQMPNSQIIESDSAHMAQFEDSKTLIAHLNSLT